MYRACCIYLFEHLRGTVRIQIDKRDAGAAVKTAEEENCRRTTGGLVVSNSGHVNNIIIIVRAPSYLAGRKKGAGGVKFPGRVPATIIITTII